MTVERTTTASPAQVWAVLSDGWTFASWVVGASRVRAVEPEFPAPGAKIHHSVGAWPVLLDDSTSVLESDPLGKLVLKARLRPFGIATVTITLRPEGAGTVLVIEEDFTSGPAALLPVAARKAALDVRNKEALHRLALLAEHRAAPEA